MSWLLVVDGPFPVGDALYILGGAIIVGFTLDAINESVSPPIVWEEKNNNTTEKGTVTKGDPPTEEDGYVAPNEGAKKGKTKDGKTGWVDKHGNIWVPAPTGSKIAHGGGHWDVQRGDGKGYTNVYPGGKIRPGGGKPPKLSLIMIRML